MDYFETLRSNGWLADPGERVRVLAIHRDECLGNWGRSCSCQPHLVMAANPRSNEVRLIENDLPTLECASGE